MGAGAHTHQPGWMRCADNSIVAFDCSNVEYDLVTMGLRAGDIVSWGALAGPHRGGGIGFKRLAGLPMRGSGSDPPLRSRPWFAIDPMTCPGTRAEAART
jgi:hypothetical protein